MASPRSGRSRAPGVVLSLLGVAMGLLIIATRNQLAQLVIEQWPDVAVRIEDLDPSPTDGTDSDVDDSESDR